MATPEQAPGLLDILADLSPSNYGLCPIGRMREQRPELGAQFDRICAVPKEPNGRFRYSETDIANWFDERGFTLDKNVVGRHRRGECRVCRSTS